MSLSSPGVGSGLDVKSIVAALVQADIAPMQKRHDSQLQNVNTEISAIGQLKSYLANLQTSLTKLSDLKQFYNTKYSVSDPDSFTVTTTAEAAKGSYQVVVKNLAQQHTLASNYLTNTGSGTLTIDFGSYNSDKTVFTPNSSATSVTVNIAPGSDSLTAVRDAINNANSSVTASIIQDGQGSRLTITSKNTGANYAMKVTGITSLIYDPTIGVDNIKQTVAAQDSEVTINGLTLTQSSNQLKDAIAGMTINLKKADINKTVTLNVDDNKDQLTGLVNEFIKQYNDSMTFLTNLTGYNPSTKQSGVFQGDPQFRNLKLQLNKWATSPLPNGGGNVKSLADLGITTNKQGLLEVNQTKYQKALDTNYKDIGALFAKTATASDSNIRIKSVDTKVKAGSYSVVLDSFNPGVSMTGTIGNLTASSADGLTLRGSGALSGLAIDVLSGTTGSRGQINVSDGIAVSMNALLDTYMSTKGDLTQRADQLNIQVKQLAKTQESINARSASTEARYFRQFNALDVLLTQMQSTSSFLTQQLANLPQLKIKN